MLAGIIILGGLCIFCIFEILYLRRMYNYMIDKYEGLVDLSTDLVKEANALSDVHNETLAEYVEFADLTQQLLTSQSEKEVEKIADKIYILIETGISRNHG